MENAGIGASVALTAGLFGPISALCGLISALYRPYGPMGPGPRPQLHGVCDFFNMGGEWGMDGKWQGTWRVLTMPATPIWQQLVVLLLLHPQLLVVVLELVLHRLASLKAWALASQAFYLPEVGC